MRKMVIAAALVLALGRPVFAGEIHTPIMKPSKPSGVTITGYIQNDEQDGLPEKVLSVLGSVLGSVLALF
jgi:hypothetical protein